MAKYWYDESELSTMPTPKRPETVDQVLSSIDTTPLDQWGRGVLEMSEEQAERLDAAIHEWNGPAHPASLEEYNAFWIAFAPATGQEHQIAVYDGKCTSWQR